MVIDFDKLIIAIKYVSKMSGLGIRKFAIERAKVNKDIIYILKNKKDITVSFLNKIARGYGLILNRFIYFDKKKTDKFNPDTDLSIDMLSSLRHEINYIKKDNKHLFKIIPNFNKPIYSFTDYINYLRGMVLFLRKRYKSVSVEFYSTFSAKNKHECVIFMVLNKNKTIHLLFRHMRNIPFVCLDMREHNQPPLTLLDKAYKQCNYKNFQSILRFIDREVLINK